MDMGDIGRPPSGRAWNGGRWTASDRFGISRDLDSTGSPFSIWSLEGDAQTQPVANTPRDEEIPRPTDVCAAINSLRERPSDFVMYFCGPSHKRYDGAVCRAN